MHNAASQCILRQSLAGSAILFTYAKYTTIRGSKLECWADKMREISAMIGWLFPYIWFVFYVSLPNQIKLLLFNRFFFGPVTVTVIVILLHC